MNSLSVFLLLSDIIPKFSSLGIILTISAVILFFFLPGKGVEMFSFDHLPLQGLTRKEPYFVAAVGLLLMFSTPSKETIRLIAASQVGEQIIQLEEVQPLPTETKAE